MASRGIPFFQQPELESVRRMREAKENEAIDKRTSKRLREARGAVRLPDDSGFMVGTVSEAGPSFGGPRQRIEKATARMQTGGPGSGPRKGAGGGKTAEHQKIMKDHGLSKKGLTKDGATKYVTTDKEVVLNGKPQGYSHEMAGHVAVHPNGSWSHNLSGQSVKSGKDAKSLSRYLGRGYKG